MKKNDVLTTRLWSKLKSQLSTIHQLGYLHLDIKLDNVLIKVDDKNQIKDVTLNDFGLMPCLIENAKNLENGDYIGICKRLCYFPNLPKEPTGRNRYAFIEKNGKNIEDCTIIRN